MPRPLQSTGRPGTPVIPENWETAPAAIVQRAMRGEVELRQPGSTQSWSDANEAMVSVPKAPYYSGVARIQNLAGQGRGRVVTAEDAEMVADYLVTVPLAVDGASEGDLVKVVDAHDGALVGRVLVVRLIEYGTERFERDLFCTLTA